LSRSLSPEFVTRADIIEFMLDGEPVNDSRPPYLERFIHGAIYEARPDINAVIHSHAEDILPFSISKTPMCCVAHVASDMGAHVPVWDIADKFGDETNLLVINMAQGRDLARKLGDNSVVRMRGHGFSAAADGLLKLVRLSVYLPRNARVLLAAMRMGEFKALSEGELRTRNRFRAGSPEMQRGWEYWARRAGCGDLLASSKGGV
jgi:HCOMODA/2-hydroxy-3-carboxy-muconic semialdehyde decarboxylase